MARHGGAPFDELHLLQAISSWFVQKILPFWLVVDYISKDMSHQIYIYIYIYIYIHVCIV